MHLNNPNKSIQAIGAQARLRLMSALGMGKDALGGSKSMRLPDNPINQELQSLTLEQRLKFAEIEVGMIQSRFDKFDQQFQGNRKLAVTITAAALAASSALDRRIVLLAACGAALIFLGIEIFHRRTLFARLVERHLLLRAALNDPTMLLTLVVYDPFNDTSVEVPKKWRREKSRLFQYEMYIFYLTLAAIPLMVLLFFSP